MARESKLMRGVTAEGQNISWLPAEPWIMGSPNLCARVEARLFAAAGEGGIMVTPTGPFVEAVPSEQLAVFAAANEVTRWEIEWTNAPDVLFGIPYGAADGPSSPPEEEPESEPTPAQRAANEAREVLGLKPL